MNPKFQFQVSKTFDGDGGFSGAVAKALEEFKAHTSRNIKRGSGTVLLTVATPEAGAYFAVVLAGPFQDLNALKAAMEEVAKAQGIDETERLGIE